MPRDHSLIADQYINDVLSGTRDENELIIAACRRHVRDLQNPRYRYLPELTNRICRFVEMFPHVVGKFAVGEDNLLKLEPWQTFCLSLFGWVRVDTGKRKYRKGLFLMAKKQGKSFLAAAIGHYLAWADGEHGAAVFSAATTESQAKAVFSPARLMLEHRSDVREAFGIEIGQKQMVRYSDNSRFELICAKPKQGKNASGIILDEYAEAESDDLLDSLVTSGVAREQQFLLIATTAGANLASPARQLQDECERMLRGHIEMDDTFAAIYTVDQAVDWTSDRAIRQSNPNFGVSIIPESLYALRDEALRDSRKESTYKTFHLNLWVNSDSAWIPTQEWALCADAPPIEDMKGWPCTLAGDLSSKLDLTGFVLCFSKEIEGKPNYYMYSRAYLPSDRLNDAKAKQTYQKWVSEGHLRTTEGNMLDYPLITEDTIGWCNEYSPRELAFDPFMGAQFAQAVEAETGTVAVEIPMRVQYLSEPMKMMEALIKDRRIHHDGSPVFQWCLANVVVHPDRNRNIFPNKPLNSALKIDLAIAAILALSRSLVPEDDSRFASPVVRFV